MAKSTRSRFISAMKLTYANIVSTLCLFLVLAGGTALAASKLAKNSVGQKQLRSNAVTGAKVKNHSLSGSDINLEKLGTVPTAARAATATTADSAGHATSAESAAVAAALTPVEPTHVIGAPGEPVFQSNSHNLAIPGTTPAPVGFYTDHEGIVHLEGLAEFGTGAGGQSVLFTLPPGDRPAAGTVQVFEVQGGSMLIGGSGSSFEGLDISGEIVGGEGEAVALGAITFRAGS